MIEKASIKTVTGPTLTGAGAIAIPFAEFEKVTNAVARIDDPFKANFKFGIKTTIATNVVTVTIEKQDHAGGAWGVAVSPGGTGDMIGKKVAVFAQGE